MQTIVHSKNYRYLSPVVSEIEQFYTLTSEKTLHSQNALFEHTFGNAFSALQSLFNQYGNCNYNFNFKDKHYEKLKLPKYNEDDVIVLFSGGKDSTAAAVKLKEDGFNVHLYHLIGINKAYPDEWKRAKQIAEYLDLPIYFEKIELSGKLGFIEHPMKNMILATRALEFGIKNNIGFQIVPGNYYSGELTEPQFYICGDDFPEVWQIYESIIQQIIPEFRIYLELESLDETLEILSENLELMNLCQSCLGAQRFRKYNHDNNEKRYGIKLLDNRCGSCWKCCVEYIYLADHDKIEYNEEYYIHCLNVLRKTDAKENGVKFEDIYLLWDGFLFYDINKSKYKNIHNYGRHK